MSSIYETLTYADALRVLHERMTARRSAWTLGAWARQLGLASTASLTNVMKGRKAPSVRLHREIIATAGLNNEEASYLGVLLRKARAARGAKAANAATTAASNAAAARLEREIAVRRQKASIRTLTLEDFRQICTPLAYAILGAVKTPHRIESPEDLLRWFPLLGSAEAVTRTWNGLVDAGWIARDEGSVSGYRSRVDTFDLPSEFRSELIRAFHEANTRSALEAIRSIPKEKRSFGSIVMGVSRERLPELQAELDRIREELIAKYGSREPDSILQVNLQAFPFIGAK